MAHPHPEYVIDRTTWKDLRGLYGILTALLRKFEDNGKVEEINGRTPLRAQLHQEAALSSAALLEQRIRSGVTVSSQEKLVWKNLNRSINVEMLRARLRAFELYATAASGIPKVTTPCLTNRNSSLVDIAQYIEEHRKAINEWIHYAGISFPPLDAFLNKSSYEKINELCHRDVYKK